MISNIYGLLILSLITTALLTSVQMANTKLNHQNKYPITKEEKIYLRNLGFSEKDFAKLETSLKEIYKYLPKGKHICLNMPDIMYEKIKKKWKKADKKDVYSIVGRVGGPEDFKRLEKEQIFCWKKH